MNFQAEFFTVVIIHLLAVMSPGPDFIMAVRNSLTYSRKVGIFTALGFALGNTVHVSYSLIGIGLIISQSILLFSVMKLLGAAYLIYIGYKAFRSKNTLTTESVYETALTPLTNFQALRTGFFTNILNPKAALFFFALFTQVVNPHTPLFVRTVYGLETSLMTFAWFSVVSLVVSHKLIKQRVSRIQAKVEKVMGVALVLLGIKVALSKAR